MGNLLEAAKQILKWYDDENENSPHSTDEWKMAYENLRKEVKNISAKSLLVDINFDRCKKCNEPLHFAMGSLFCPNPKC